MNPGKQHLLALAATLVLSGHAAAQVAGKAVPVREAARAISNTAGEIRYTVVLDSYYTSTLVDAAREAGYVHAQDAVAVGAGLPESEKPEVRFAADRIAALIGKKPEAIQSEASTQFDVFASAQEILRLTTADGVTDIAQREGRMDLIEPPSNRPTQVTSREAMKPVINEAGEIGYIVRLNPFYTSTLVDAAREAGYVQADINVVCMDAPDIEKPEVRFAADRIAALIGKKPEKVLSGVGTQFSIYASREEITRLAAAEGVTGIAQMEDISGMIGPGILPPELPRENAPQERRWWQIRSAQERVLNEQGEVGYIVRLNPFYVDALKSDALAAGYVQADISEVGVFSPEVEKPEVRFVADKIAGLIKKRPAKVRSWVATEFDVYANPEAMQGLIGLEGITGISEMEGKIQIAPAQSMPTAPGDVWSGNEIIPWWKISVNTNDTQDFTYSQNIPVVIDGHMAPPISPDLNMVSIGGYTASPPNDAGRSHAVNVNGVIGARANNYLIRGINPGQPIRHIGINWQDNSTIFDAFNAAYLHYAVDNSWGAINFSTTMSGLGWSNLFEFSASIGRMMAVASNRSIILQAAGNYGSNACGWGYQYTNHTLEYDGILLIGGHDRGNQRSSHSNAGACVELWAPSEQMTTLRYNANTTQVVSGTSFAAPIAMAIAMRYGDKNTRPLEREHFLRANAQDQGHIAGHPARFVKYGDSADKLRHHPVFGVWSPQGTSGISALYNGNYGDMWNAGGNYGSIVIDLGSEKNVRYIRVTPRSSVDLHEVYPLHFAVAPAASFSGNLSGGWQYYNYPKHGDMAPLTIPLTGNDINTRYVVLDAYNYGSWLAYSEVEVYGK